MRFAPVAGRYLDIVVFLDFAVETHPRFQNKLVFRLAPDIEIIARFEFNVDGRIDVAVEVGNGDESNEGAWFFVFGEKN